MQYTFIKTKPYEKSVQDFLDVQTPVFITKWNTFKKAFSHNPFTTSLHTHDIFQKNNTIIFSSYVTKKIRLIRLLIKPNTIIPYRIVTDHDYNKIKQVYPAILALANSWK